MIRIVNCYLLYKSEVSAATKDPESEPPAISPPSPMQQDSSKKTDCTQRSLSTGCTQPTPLIGQPAETSGSRSHWPSLGI